MKFIILALLLGLLGGCRSYTAVTAEMCAALNEEHGGQELALKRSMYYGQFYDDSRYLLLSEWPFENTPHLPGMKGNPITPGNQAGIIPIGTKVRIVRLEFPDKDNFKRRMLFTPRYHPWAILELLTEDPFFPTKGKKLVLVLPMEIKTKEQVAEALSYHLGNFEEIRAYLVALDPSIKVALTHKEVVNGMSYQEVLTTLGKPLAVDDLVKEGITTRTMTYGHLIVTLVDGLVTAIAPNKEPKMHNATL